MESDNKDTSFDMEQWMDMAKLFSDLVEEEPTSQLPAPVSPESMVSSFDLAVASPKTNMLKAVIPYLEVSQQRYIGIIIKSLELKKVLELYPTSQLSSLENPFPKPSQGKVGILRSIRPHCPKEKQQIVDMMLNFFTMQEVMGKAQLFQDIASPPTDLPTNISPPNTSNLLGGGNMDSLLQMLELFSAMKPQTKEPK